MDRRPGKNFAVSGVILDHLQCFAYAGLRAENQWRLQKAATEWVAFAVTPSAKRQDPLAVTSEAFADWLFSFQLEFVHNERGD